jgi:hypothetical protein
MEKLEVVKFNKDYPLLFSFCINDIGSIIDQNKSIIIKAQVKSGKRIMVQCLSTILATREHIFITALDRIY